MIVNVKKVCVKFKISREESKEIESRAANGTATIEEKYRIQVHVKG